MTFQCTAAVAELAYQNKLKSLQHIQSYKSKCEVCSTSLQKLVPFLLTNSWTAIVDFNT